MERIKSFFLIFFLITLSFVEARVPKVLIASTIRENPEVLNVFLKSLESLEKKGLKVEFFFIDNNIEPKSRQLLTKFKQKTQKVHLTPSNKINISNLWVPSSFTQDQTELFIWTLAAHKDEILKFGLSKNFDYVFLIDANVAVQPKTLLQLISDKKEIISNIFWITHGNNELPQVWLRDINTRFDVKPGEAISTEEAKMREQKFIHQLKEPGVYEVGGLGACTLISRSALEKGVCFERMPNLSYASEDAHFCIRAMAIGIPLYVDTHYPASLRLQ